MAEACWDFTHWMLFVSFFRRRLWIDNQVDMPNCMGTWSWYPMQNQSRIAWLFGLMCCNWCAILLMRHWFSRAWVAIYIIYNIYNIIYIYILTLPKKSACLPASCCHMFDTRYTQTTRSSESSEPRGFGTITSRGQHCGWVANETELGWYCSWGIYSTLCTRCSNRFEDSFQEFTELWSIDVLGFICIHFCHCHFQAPRALQGSCFISSAISGALLGSMASVGGNFGFRFRSARCIWKIPVIEVVNSYF